jgi:hypothetical protein
MVSNAFHKIGHVCVDTNSRMTNTASNFMTTPSPFRTKLDAPFPIDATYKFGIGTNALNWSIQAQQ